MLRRASKARSSCKAAERGARIHSERALGWRTALVLTALSSVHATKADEPSLPFERYQLPNGLTVILHQDNRLPLTAVSIWYDVGAISERPGRSGFAHLFEHMMFQASPHVGEDMYFKRLQEIGGTNINGTTDFDRTNYFETVPSNELERVLWLESDRMGFLLSSLTEKSLRNQIDVVSNERRQSVENAPYGLMEEMIIKTVYPEPHPYHGAIVGSLKDIASASLEDVHDFFKTYYTPANATLTIAGDIKPDATKALVEKYFGPINGRPKPERPKVGPPVIDKEQLIHFDEPVANLAKVAMIWVGPAIFSDDTAALDLATYVISGTRSSRLDRKVTYDKLIAESVTARFEEKQAGSLFSIELNVRPDHTIEEAKQAIDEVLADLKKHPPTEAELKRGLNSDETGTIHGLEALGGFGGRAERLQLYNHYLGDPGKLQWDLERYRKVTTKDVARVIDKYLGDKRLVVFAVPKKRDTQASQGAEQ
jgi:predicted Zn-dependent peptidase